MAMKKRVRLSAVHWSILIFIVAQIFTFFIISQSNIKLDSPLGGRSEEERRALMSGLKKIRDNVYSGLGISGIVPFP